MANGPARTLTCRRLPARCPIRWARSSWGPRWSGTSVVGALPDGSVVVVLLGVVPLPSSGSITSVASTWLTRFTSSLRRAKAPITDVEAERSTLVVEELLHAGLAADGALHDVGAEVVGRQRPRDARAPEQLGVGARRVVLEQDDEQVVGTQLVDRAAGEVTHTGRHRDRRRVQHRVGGLLRRRRLALDVGVGGGDLAVARSTEEATLPTGRQRHLDAVGDELGHGWVPPSGRSVLGSV